MTAQTDSTNPRPNHPDQHPPVSDKGTDFEGKKPASDEGDTDVAKTHDFEAAILETGFGKYNILLILASIPGFFGCINMTSNISLILPSAECDLDLNTFDKGLMNSISYIGMISCAFLWGFLSDTLGRKWLLVAAFFIDVILSVMVALAQSFTFFLVAKLFSGFISAGPYAILMAYLAECHASKYRASVLVWTGALSSLGTICLPAIAWWIIPQPIHLDFLNGTLHLPSWRIFLLVTAIPSLIASILLSLFGESPKFLMSRGKSDEALAVFRRMYATNTGKPRDTFPVKSLTKETPTAREDSKDIGKFAFLEQAFAQIRPLFQKPHVRNAVLIFCIQFCTLSGLNTVRLWTPQMFSLMINKETSGMDHGATTVCELLTPDILANTTEITPIIQCTEHLVEPRVYFNSMIIGVITAVGYLASGYLVSVLGKKLLIIILYAIAGSCCIGMYWSNTSNIMLGLTSVFITLTSIGTTTIVSVIVDLLPTAQRTMGVSLSLMFGRTGALVGNLTFAWLLEWNCQVLFFLIAGITLGSGAFSMLLPRTKGAALK